MNFGELSTGIAMDLLVAESVMGWKIREHRDSGRDYVGWDKCDGNGVSWFAANPADRGEDWFAPSTNIAHAFEVMEKLQLRLIPCVDRAGWYCCEGDCEDLGLSKIGRIADTAPLAICRAALAWAALKAVGP